MSTRRYSSEYKAFQPFVIEDIRRIVQGDSVRVGSGSALVAHALADTSIHVGPLAQSQAPWAATKSELATHAADPNAHHAQVHNVVGGDHTASGSQYQVVGLTAANTLGLLTPSANPGAAAAILRTDSAGKLTLRTLEVVSDLFVDGSLDMGVNTLYEDASYLQLSGSKPVRFGQNIGNANWTIFSTGGAQFNGNLDVLSGGDLYVAGSGSYAGLPVLFADSSGGNVGILRSPDPQFALDVAGPLRATYLIGQHAIAIPNVALLAHFDSRRPYETNFAGDPNGHMGQIGSVTGGVIFRPGKFDGAIQIAGATTNYVANPSFEVDTSNWLTGFTGTGGALARDTSLSYVGGACARITASSGGNYFIRSNQISLPNGSTVTVQCRMRRMAAVSAQLQIRDITGGSTRATAAPTLLDTWERLTCSWTNNTGVTATIELRVNNMQGDGVSAIWVDACQMELSGYGTPYCDGSLGGYDAGGAPDGSGHAWTGTAHASSSTRAAATLSYPTAGNMNAAKWTVMAWVLPVGITAGNQEVLRATGTVAGNIILRLDTAGKPQAWAGTSSVTAAAAATVGVWTHLAAVYDGANLRLYVNGVQAASGAVSGFDGMPTSMYVGCSNGSGGNPFNGMIDDLCILPYAYDVTNTGAVDPASVRSIYESNAPVFAETSVYVFRVTPKGLINGDDEGFWMRDTQGNPVLGIYGGEAASKSWAGFTLGVGDLVIGRNAVGAAALRWTQATGKFGFYGGGNATPQVEIGTDGRITAINADLSGAITATSGSIAGLLSIGASGEIRQGTGTLGTNFTGLRVWQSGNVGLIGGYNNNLLQWYADTDGSLHAGAGVLAIGLAGIQIAVPASWTNVNGYQFVLSPYTLSAGLFAQYISGSDRMYTRQQTLSPDFTTVTVSSLAQNTKGVGGFASNDMAATAGTTTAIIELFADRAGGVGSARIAANVLKLENLTTNTGAVGTYAGKVKINIGGTDVWIPYYSS